MIFEIYGIKKSPNRMVHLTTGDIYYEIFEVLMVICDEVWNDKCDKQP